MAQKKWSPPPIPNSVIPAEAFDVGEPDKCGVIEFAEGDIKINEGRKTANLVMVNTGDRPIQIGAHYHLAECNRAMAFDRESAFGMHLDIASGSAIRFEPGQSRKVQVTEFAGRQVAYGMNNMTNGTTRSEIIRDRTMRRLREEGYCFEGERFNVVEPADKKFNAKK